MIDSHPEIACGPESGLFRPVLNATRLSELFDISRDAIHRLEARSDCYPEFVSRFLRIHADNEGKRVWAEKTPRNILNLGWILDRFPNVVFCHVVRDGRAVVNSLRTHPKYRWERGRLLANEISRDIDSCIDRWLSMVEAGLQFASHPRVIEVRYEEIVTDPKAALEPVLRMIGCRWHDQILRFHEVTSQSRNTRHFPATPEAALPLTDRPLSRWRNELSSQQVARINERGHDVLRQLGYL